MFPYLLIGTICTGFSSFCPIAAVLGKILEGKFILINGMLEVYVS